MTMKNKSGLHPQGHSVLVQAYDPETKALESTLILPDSVKQNFQVLENRVRVVEVGPAAWKGDSFPGEQGSRAKPGDVVFVTKHAGFVANGADGEVYRLVNDRDIFCVMDEALFEAARLRKEQAA